MAYYFDDLIVSELRKGQHSEALKELYKTHYPMVLHLVCSNSGSEQEAKDVYQECIINFFEKVQQPDFVLSCKIKTYIYAVCRRLWLKRLAEKKKFNVQIEVGESYASVDEDVEETEDATARFNTMGKALEGLGEPCRSIVEDFYIRDLSMEEISARHGHANAESAKNQKYKCLQRLKKLFFSDYKGES